MGSPGDLQEFRGTEAVRPQTDGNEKKKKSGQSAVAT